MVILVKHTVAEYLCKQLKVGSGYFRLWFHLMLLAPIQLVEHQSSMEICSRKLFFLIVAHEWVGGGDSVVKAMLPVTYFFQTGLASYKSQQ